MTRLRVRGRTITQLWLKATIGSATVRTSAQSVIRSIRVNEFDFILVPSKYFRSTLVDRSIFGRAFSSYLLWDAV
jgi:hypothetical protein